MDTLLLSRLQFAANISFHILFPTITIALGWWLLVFRWRWVRTRDVRWLQAWRFWTKVFALTFGLGVVSGITMSFQFGTNWPGFMVQAGNVAGPLLGYEVLTAFFLEATFLGVMLFGHERVSERMHLIATFLVAFGTTMSAFWILALNSWMQTPAGVELVNGVFHVRNWFEVIFNPSFPYRLTHMLLASALTATFLLAGVSAWRVLRGTASDAAPVVMRSALTVAAILVPLQILAGDFHGLNTLQHQPQKIAAMEAVWETERGAPLVLFGLPDEETRSTHFAVEVPRLASLILTHDPNGEIKGLNEFQGEHPPVAPVFWSFRVMVGVGMLMLLVSWVAWFLLKRASWQPEQMPRPALQALRFMTFSGWIATLAGWYVTEIGRQPYLVFGHLRTADLVTKTPSGHVLATLIGFLIMYAVLIIAYIAVLRYMSEKPLIPPSEHLKPGATS